MSLVNAVNHVVVDVVLALLTQHGMINHYSFQVMPLTIWLAINLETACYLVVSSSRGGFMLDNLPLSKAYPCEICGLMVKVSLTLCVKCGRWIHSRCTGLRMVTPHCQSICLQ